MDRDIRAPSAGPPPPVAVAPPGLPGAAASAPPTDYVQRLYKLIPAEISAAYLAISSLLIQTVPGSDPGAAGWSSYDKWLLGAFVVLLIGLPFYMYSVQGVRTPAQIVATTISFPIWAANVSAALVSAHFGVPTVVLGAALILWTTLLPIFVR